jgi:hypothetical protein
MAEGTPKDFVVKNGLVVNSSLIYATAGKVGVNNTSPIAELDVTGNINVNKTAGAKLGFNVTDTFSPVGGVNTAVNYGLSTGATAANRVELSGYSGLSLFTTSAERITIDAGGNVGISNNNPNAKLQITGTANIDGVFRVSGNVTLSGTFTNVTSTFQGAKTDIGNTVITGTANVTGNVLISGTFVNVTGTLQGTKTDIGNTVITGTANVTGNVLATGAFINVTGTLQGTKTNIGNTVITGTANVTGNVLATGTFINVTGTLQGTKTDIGNTVITGTANVTGNVLATGAFVNVTGDVQSATLRTGLSTITGNITASGSFVNVTGTFQGTKTDVGNTVITGTANVTGNILASGTFVNVTGDLQSATLRTGLSTITGNLTTSGAFVNVTGTFQAGKVDHGNTVITGTANVTGNILLSGAFTNVTGTFQSGVTAHGNTTVTGNLTISTGVVTGNGFGLTSVNYLSQSTSDVDVEIFGSASAGGDINTWKDGTRFYPTLPSNINTLDMNIYTEIFIRQVADQVANNSMSGAGGPGNPELTYRIIKVPTAGANTTLLTADFQTISVPGSASFFLNSIRDSTPTSGNTVAYLLQYQWRSIDADPNANAGTITVSNNSTLNASGTGSYFTSKLNTRLQISPGALAFRTINTIYGNRLLGVDTAFGTAQTAVTYRVRDLYANVSMAQTNVAFNFVGYK